MEKEEERKNWEECVERAKHTEKWTDLYQVSNWLNMKGVVSDTWFWFLAVREDYTFEDCRSLLEVLWREELGVPMGEHEPMFNLLKKHRPKV